MSAKIIDGKALAQEIRADLKAEVKTLVNQGNRPPLLAVVLVGDDPASHIYVERKKNACHQVGIASRTHMLKNSTTQSQLRALIESLGEDSCVDGILVQLPLPGHLDPIDAIGAIAPNKDVDGLTAKNKGALVNELETFVPCTPMGIMHLFRAISCDLKGKLVLVVGRSALVGSPVAELLSQANATVIKAHSETKNIKSLSVLCDILVVCAGVRGLVDEGWVKPGAVVIDVGIHRTENGLCGDVEFERVREKASYITPVPGGVGPMTIASLLVNTMKAYRQSHHREKA